jgi:amidase
MSDLHFQDSTDLLKGLGKGDFSSRELLTDLLAQVDKVNDKVNAIVTFDRDRAFAMCDAADSARKKGEKSGALCGLPMTIKDTYETEGLLTTAGAPEFREHVPATDAVPVARLKQAGAIVFGKTNLPTYASDIQSFNPLFGTTNNPYDFSKTSGGSSGGAAVALATGMSPLELGSDLAGSIRVPSAFCGVFGHKPSFGTIPMRGHIPGPPGTLSVADIAVSGPMARSARDLKLALSTMVGPDAAHGKAWKFSLAKPRAKKLSDFRVACWFDDDFCPVEQAHVAILEDLADELEKAGAKVDRKARPGFSLSKYHRVYYNLMATVAASGMPAKTLKQLTGALPLLKIGNALGRFPDDMIGFAKAAGQTTVKWAEMNEDRAQFGAMWAKFFEEYDVLLVPPICSTAIDHNQASNLLTRKFELDGKSRSYLDLFIWPGLAGSCGLPATVAPVGMTPAGLPAGVEIIGPFLEDLTTIEFAGQLQRLLPALPRPMNL